MSFFFGRSNSNGDSGKNNNNPSNSSNDSNTNNPSPVNLKENQAQVLLNTAQQAYNNGNLDDALTFYTESIQLYLEVYKIEADNNKKALLYHTMEETMVRAENIKRQIRERDQVIAAAQEIAKANNSTISSNPSALKPSANDSTTPKLPKTSRRDPSTKPLPLPDDYDFSAPKKPLSNAPKRAATPTGKTTATGAAKKATGAATTNNTSVTTGGAAKAEVHAPKTNEYTSQIMEEILDKSPEVRWDDIAGLSFAKQTLQEAVILPNLRPDLFTGLRKPPKGVLLFGPPGTGKTLLAKAVATESGFVFFSISASSVTSKYLGEGEKLIKALFDLAREKQPSVIFIDEIDSLMSARKDNEHEASRRLKTEFMTQMDGAASTGEDRILVMGATNIPWDIDEAVLRRMAKRIYVPLPDVESRKALIIHLLKKQGPSAGHITSRELDRIVNLTEGYSGSDLAAVCSEAALGPIREIGPAALKTVKVEEVRPINLQDFVNALKIIRPSVSGDSLKTFQRWAEQFGVTR